MMNGDESSTADGPRLARSLGLLDAVGIGFGAIVGAGIFVIIGVEAGLCGSALLIGLVLAGIAASANALSSAQLAAEYPEAGGTYEYGYRVLHPAAGFAAGWMFLASKITAASTVAIGLADYLTLVVPGISPRVFAVGAVLTFTALNYFGIRRSSGVNLVIVAISLSVLVTFVIAGATAFDRARLEPIEPGGFRSVLEAGALLFFAYTGYARIATLGEEVRDPRHTIPRAIIITFFGAIALYFAVAFVALGAVGAETLAGTGAPLAAAAESTGLSWLPIVVAIGGMTAMLGVILSQILGLSRMVFAMARRGDLPRPLQHIHPRTGVPGRAILLVGGVAASIAATGSLESVAAIAAFTILIYYGIANLAALKMPEDAKRYPDMIPLAGLVGCVVLAGSLDIQTVAAGAGTLTAGFIVREFLHRSRQTAPSGER